MHYISKHGRGSVWNLILCPCITVVFYLQLTSGAYAQVDPGIRGGDPGAGKRFQTGLSPGERDFFDKVAVDEFTQIEGVDDGLGPRFNLDSCSGCHAHPEVGGSSPPRNNPQVTRLREMAPGNELPSFIKIDGPVREVRFIHKKPVTTERGR